MSSGRRGLCDKNEQTAYNRRMITGHVCTESEVWDEIVHDLDGHPLQLWGWGELKVAHNWRAHRIIFTDDDGGVVGAAQVLSRSLPGPFRRVNYVPRGPVWRVGQEDVVLDALIRYAKQHLPGVVMTVEPDDDEVSFPKGWQKSKNTILIPRTIILDLNMGEPELQSVMAKKTRQYIRKSSAENLVVKRVKTPEAISPLLEIYHQTAERAHFAIHDDQYYYDAQEMMGESSIIFAAYEDETPVAFVWLAASSKTAFELYGGVNDRGQELRANYMLKWHAISRCKEWGIDRYDMNGLLNDGISTFKQSFADHEDMLVGTYDYPMSPLYTTWTRGLPIAKKIIRRMKKLTRRS